MVALKQDLQPIPHSYGLSAMEKRSEKADQGFWVGNKGVYFIKVTMTEWAFVPPMLATSLFEYAVAVDGEDSAESWSFYYNLHTSSEKPGFI